MIRRLLRILRNALTFLSLLLCLASLVFWIRSHSVRDAFPLTSFPGQWSLVTHAGSLLLERNYPWVEPAEVKAGMKTHPYKRSFLGFSAAESQEVRTWQGESPQPISYLTKIKTYSFPFWFCVAVFSILPLIRLRHLISLRRRRRRNLCPHCGYDIRATPNRCPECGRQVTNMQSPNPKVSTPAPP
jgi:hypothetical protein